MNEVEEQPNKKTTGKSGESEEKIERRRARKREWMANKRRSMSEEEKDTIKLLERERKSIYRLVESPQQKYRRLSADKQRKALARTQETPEQYQQRLLANQQRTANARALETLEQYQQRLSADKQRKLNARAQETPEQYQQRLLADKQRKSKARAQETPEQYEQRLSADKQRKSKARAQETPEQYEQRLLASQIRSANARAQETPEQRQRRLFANRQRTANARAQETPEQRQQRLSANRQRTADARAQGSQHETGTRQRNVNVTKPQPVSDPAQLLHPKVLGGPIYRCAVCHRLMYRGAVVNFAVDQYSKLPNELKQENHDPGYEDGAWICMTCHNTMEGGQLPAPAWANGLHLSDIPDEMKDLKPLELRLISKRIHMMKMEGQPKEQKDVHDKAINIPTKSSEVCGLLPRPPGLRGHSLSDYIRPDRVLNVLLWLKQNNPLYEDLVIPDDWEQQWLNDDQELWQTLTAQVPEPDTDLFSGLTTDTPTDDQSGYTEHTMDHMHAIAAQHGFTVEHVPGDGNGFFSAVLVGMTEAGMKLQLTPDVLRHTVVQHLKSPEGSHYMEFVTGPSEATDKDSPCTSDGKVSSWNRYIECLEHGARADNVAVQALADIMLMEINILATLNPNAVTRVKPVGSGQANITVTIGLIGQTHYVALHKVVKTEDG